MIAAMLGAAVATGSSAAERDFATGYAGSLPADPRLRARTYFNLPGVRRLIYDLEAGPVTRERVAAALEGTPYAIDDLVRVRLIAPRDGRFHLNFNYYTADDMRAIHRAIDARVPALVRAFEDRRDELAAILSLYSPRFVPREHLAFVLVSGMSLNWQALDLLRRRGWREPILAEGEGWAYSFWAAELDEEYSIREFYWGSSTFPAGAHNLPDRPVDFAFSSFGDPESDPRPNFPDLLYTSRSELPPRLSALIEAVGPVTGSSLGIPLEEALGFERTRDVGAILFALRERPRTLTELHSVVAVDALPALVALLEAIEYVVRDSAGTWHLRVPVLDVADAEVVDGVLKLSGEILESWLSDNYAAMRRELAGLVALRRGVPFESLFTQIWHDVFGLATKQLARAGVTANPRAADVRFPGSLACVWRHSLYDFSPG